MDDRLKSRLSEFYTSVVRQSDIDPANLHNKQFNALLESLGAIEHQLKWLASLHNFDTWYPCLRRELLGCSFDMDSGGLLLATHILQKYSPHSSGKNDSRVTHETHNYGTVFRHDHVLTVDDDYDLQAECEAFWELVALYRQHQTLLRHLGYGGTFRITADGKPEVRLSEATKATLQHHAMRRARDEAFSEHGVPLRTITEGCEYVIALVPTLQSDENLETHYRMTVHAWAGSSVRDFFGGYDRSLKLTYGLTPDDLTHALVSLSKPVLAAMLALGDHLKPTGNSLEIVDPVPTAQAYNANIVRQLLLKGYARLPTNQIANQIEITSTYWCHDQERRAVVSRQFLSAFSKTRPSAVDIERGIGGSLLVPANGDYTYVDYGHMRSFLSATLLGAQRYLASQHGYNFNLLLVERIREIDPDFVIDLQVKFFVGRPVKGKKSEGDWDILLLVGGHAICVECKAFLESDAAARGYPDRLRKDAKKVSDAVTSNRMDLEILRELLPVHPALASLRDVRSFSGVVCTLKSEYTNGADINGVTPCGLHEVCSMTELLDYCREKKAQALSANSAKHGM